MIKISKRLTMAASLISEGKVLADVGTDHGYVPIYLVEQGKIHRAVAMDINKGPLERAKEHIAQYGMEQYIETRLSDGVEALSAGEADAILIAGMGGGLVMHILTEGKEVCQNADELILQPQSELERVRRFLAEEGYVTDAEEMVEEDGKYYPMMRVHYEPQKSENHQNAASGQTEQADAVELAEHAEGVPQAVTAGRNELMETVEVVELTDTSQNVFFMYGRQLLENKHPVLQEFLQKEQQVYQGILENLRKQPQTEQIVSRTQEIEAALKLNIEALSYY